MKITYIIEIKGLDTKGDWVIICPDNKEPADYKKYLDKFIKEYKQKEPSFKPESVLLSLVYYLSINRLKALGRPLDDLYVPVWNRLTTKEAATQEISDYKAWFKIDQQGAILTDEGY
jgi:hypothetical protein